MTDTPEIGSLEWEKQQEARMDTEKQLARGWVDLNDTPHNGPVGKNGKPIYTSAMDAARKKSRDDDMAGVQVLASAMEAAHKKARDEYMAKLAKDLDQ